MKLIVFGSMIVVHIGVAVLLYRRGSHLGDVQRRVCEPATVCGC